jgi:hypothetical protein
MSFTHDEHAATVDKAELWTAAQASVSELSPVKSWMRSGAVGPLGTLNASEIRTLAR